MRAPVSRPHPFSLGRRLSSRRSCVGRRSRRGGRARVRPRALSVLVAGDPAHAFAWRGAGGELEPADLRAGHRGARVGVVLFAGEQAPEEAGELARAVAVAATCGPLRARIRSKNARSGPGVWATGAEGNARPVFRRQSVTGRPQRLRAGTACASFLARVRARTSASRREHSRRSARVRSSGAHTVSRNPEAASLARSAPSSRSVFAFALRPHTRKGVTNRATIAYGSRGMRCVECDTEADERARLARVDRPPAMGRRTAQTALYCPACARREFGPPLREVE